MDCNIYMITGSTHPAGSTPPQMWQDPAGSCICRIQGCLSASMAATCFVWTAPLLVKHPFVYGNDPRPSLENCAMMVPLGMAFFSLPAGFLADKIGRKTTLLMAPPTVFVGWIMLLFSTNEVVMYIASAIQGFAAAIVHVVGPAYLAETSESGKRGLFSGQFQVMSLVGVAYAYTMGSIFNYSTWDDLHYYIGIQTVFPVVALVTFYVMPESPYYLLMAGRNEQALDSLQWLRGHDDVTAEYTLVKESVEKEIAVPRSCNDIVATTSDQRSLSIVVLLSVLRSLSGMSAAPVYIFKQLSEDAEGIFSSRAMAINLTVVSLICAFAATLVVDFVGRKPILVFATIGSTAFSSVVAIFYSLETTVDSHSWIMYAALVGLSVTHNVGLGGLMHTVQAEYFPCKTRAVGGALSVCLFGLLNFAGLYSYKILRASQGTFLYYGMYTFIAVLGIAVLPVAFHESAGRTLAQIQEIGICRKKSTKAQAVIE